MIQHFLTRCTTLALAAFLSGCGADEHSRVGRVISDSAGVRIVDNFDSVWSGGNAWRIDSVPSVVIGVLEGEPQYAFSEVSGAARLSDGRIAVLDGGASEIRMYSRQGKFIEAAGGRGGGPGEFRTSPQQLVATAGDTLLVLAGEVSRFTGNLSYVDRWLPNREPASLILPAGRSSEGLYLMQDGGFVVPAHEIPIQGKASPLRRFGGYILVSDVGDASLLEPFPSDDYQSSFGRYSVFAAGGSPPRLAIGDNVRYEISVFSSKGRLVQRIRNARPNEAVSAADLDDVRRMLTENASDPEQAAEWLREFDRKSHANTWPAFGELFIDRASHLWVRDRRPQAYNAERYARWEVYDPEGVFLGEVQLPAMLWVYDIGDDYILGAFFSDPLGTQQVRQYALHRTPSD